MNKYFTMFLLAAVFAVQAKQIDNPDANTLWLEDGKEMKLSDSAWFSRWGTAKGDKAIEVKAKAADGSGSFSFTAKDANGRKILTRTKLSPDYPYLTFRITGFDLFKGYRSWCLAPEGNFTSSQVLPRKGIYVYDMYQNIPEKAKAKKADYMVFYLYSLQLDFDYIKIVKKPDYLARVECADAEIKPGSKVKFIAELAKEAEDVSITLFTDYLMDTVKVNGAAKIQLKPTDKTQKVWSAEVEVKSIGLKKAVKRHKIFMKMDVLGGDLDEPVWVGLPYPVAP